MTPAPATSSGRSPSRAKEVAQYLDPAVTSQVAVAAVPDAAYAVLRRAHADAWAKGVVIVPYSSALPIVLFLYSLVQRFGDAADVQTSLAEVSSALELDGRRRREQAGARRDHAHERRRRAPLPSREGARLDRARGDRERPVFVDPVETSSSRLDGLFRDVACRDSRVDRRPESSS